MAQLSLKDTRELRDFLFKLLDKMIEAKADDGKIDTGEWLTIAMTSSPSAIKAVMGIQNVDDELRDLDDKETLEVAKMGIELMEKLSSLFIRLTVDKK